MSKNSLTSLESHQKFSNDEKMKQNLGERGTGKSRFVQEKRLDIHAAATATETQGNVPKK